MLALGMVSHYETAERNNLLPVISYFVECEQLLLRKAAAVAKAITRGEMPAPKPPGAGRPRTAGIPTIEAALPPGYCLVEN